jgi:hypothetical protein
MVSCEMNLFSTANRNGAAIERRFHNELSLLTPEEADDLERFVDIVKQQGRVAINMRQMVLLNFLTFEKHHNIYEWAQLVASYSSMTVDDILREKLKAYYERRVAFDSFFHRGNEFHYGTLSLAGMGLTYYGNFCSAFRDETFSTSVEIAYLRDDSLKTYVNAPDIVDSAAIERDATPHTHKHYLAGIKHAGGSYHIPETQWPSMLCSNTDFIEAVFVRSLTPDDLQEVRMLKSDYDLFFHYAFEEFREKLSEADRALVDGFVMILKHLRDRGVHLEVIE